MEAGGARWGVSTYAWIVWEEIEVSILDACGDMEVPGRLRKCRSISARKKSKLKRPAMLTPEPDPRYRRLYCRLPKFIPQFVLIPRAHKRAADEGKPDFVGGFMLVLLVLLVFLVFLVLLLVLRHFYLFAILRFLLAL